MFDAILNAARDLPQLTVGPTTTVITEGEPVHQLLVLETGSLSVTREGAPLASLNEPGVVFGEMSVLLGTPATATVRTIGECTFRVSDDPQGFLRAQPEVALLIATILARRLDAVSRYLVDIREQYADRDDHLRVVDVVLDSLTHRQGTESDPGSDREQEAPY
jgi:CRP/FNR family transcriptional regulator, cyclic AMP receptor protein